MTETERGILIATIVQLIERRLRDAVWVYWPPGPMVGQVFDRKRCEADVTNLVNTIAAETKP